MFARLLLKELGDVDILKDAERTSGRDNGLPEVPHPPAPLVVKLWALWLGWAVFVEDDNDERCNDDNNASSVLSFTIVDGYWGWWWDDSLIRRGALRRRRLTLLISDERYFDFNISFVLSAFDIVCLVINRDDVKFDSVVNLDAGGDEGGIISTFFRDSDVDDGWLSLEEVGVNTRRKNETSLAIDRICFIKKHNKDVYMLDYSSVFFKRNN